MSSVAKARKLKPPFARKRDFGGHRAVEAKAYNWCGGVQPPTFQPSWADNGTPGLTGTLSSMSDIVTPGYKELIARGAVINNPMSLVTMKLTGSTLAGRTVRQVVGSFSTLGGNAGYRYAAYDLYGDWMALCFGRLSPDGRHTSLKDINRPPFSTQALINQATIEALNRVAPAQAQSWVAAAESQKTIDMVADRARKIAKCVQACKGGDTNTLDTMFPGKRTKRYPKRVVIWDDRGNPVTGKSGNTRAQYSHPPLRETPSKMDAASKMWLEYRYGWTPLIHDIVDGMKALYADDLRKELIHRERITARGTAHQAGTVTSNSTSSINWAFGTLSATTVAEHDFTVRAYILYKPIANTLLRRMNDFGAFDVPRAIWELVPWSFVIDWFVPIGDWLGALTPKVGVEVLASGYETTYKMKVVRTITNWVSNPSSGDLRWDQSPLTTGTADQVEMTEINRSPFLLTPTFPPVQVKLNLNRLVDAVTLLKGQRPRYHL